MYWLLLLLLLLLFLLLFFFSITKFIINYVIYRKFSIKNGINLITKTLKINRISIVFIFDKNQDYFFIHDIKACFKKHNINYVNVKSYHEFLEYFKIYKQLFKLKFVILTVDYKLYFKDFDNLLILNVDSKNINNDMKSVKNLIITLSKSLDYTDTKINYICFPSYYIYNELEYACNNNLIYKKQKINLNELDYQQIILPEEYFLFKNYDEYLLKKSKYDYVYMRKNNNYPLSSIIKIIDLNKRFSGINDSYDFNHMIKQKNSDYIKNFKLNLFLSDYKLLTIIIDNNILIPRDIALIINDLKTILNLEIYLYSLENYDLNKNYIICSNKIIKERENILIFNLINYYDLFYYIYSKLLELNINQINNNNIFFKKNKNDLLIYNSYNFDRELFDKIFWKQNLIDCKVDINKLIDIINIKQYKKLFLHIVLDGNLENNNKLINKLIKYEIKFIIYNKGKKILFDKISLNNINLNLNQINILNLKKIVNYTFKGLMVNY